MKEKACRSCNKLYEDEKECPVCHSTESTTFWSGLVYFVNPEKSEVAQKMGIKGQGKYALRLSR